MANLKYLLSPVAALLIPAGQAAITALAGGLIAASLAWWQGVPRPLAIGGLAFGLIFGAAWLVGVMSWRGLVEGEKITPVQAYPSQTVRVEVSQNDGNMVDWIDLPISRAKLVRMACGVVQGQNFSISAFGGRSKLLSRSEFEALRDEMIKRGLAYWISPHSHSRGCELNRAGVALMRRMASTPPLGREARQRMSAVDGLADTHTHT